MTLTYAEFCAGYGGLGLAVEEVFDAELRWYSEFEPAPSKIMEHHWPGVPNHGDMTTIDFTQVEPVDILSGGTPCQDLSHAGRRAGMRKGTRSGLWESMREAIATIQPKYVVWENVRGAYSAGADSAVEQCEGCMGEAENSQPVLRALGRVLGDLADLGFDAEWRGLRAADVGAPHGRFRVFILATNTNSRDDHGRVTDAERQQVQRITPTRSSQADRGIATSDPIVAGLERQHDQARTASAERHGHPSAGVDWREYTGAVRRWEALHGAAPTPVELGPTGKPRLSAAFTEWMMGLPAGWVTATPGVKWADQLKALGNGVVPQQAADALRHMLTVQQLQESAA